MFDLRDELQKFAGTIDEYRAVSVEEALIRARHENRHRSPLLVASAAAVVVIALVGSAVALGLFRGESGPFADGTETTAAPTTTLTTTTHSADTATSTVPVTDRPVTTSEPTVAVPTELQMSWRRIEGQGALANAWLTSITEAGPGLVAGGYVKGGTREDWTMEAAVWVSADGETWERIDDPAVFGNTITDDSLVTGVMATEDGVVALGYEGYERRMWTSPDGYDWAQLDEWPYLTMSGPTGGDRVWLSVDGVAWYESRHIGDGFLDAYNVVAGGPGFVAVGSEVLSRDPNAYETRSVIWVSSDGVEWQRIADDEVGGFGVFERVAAGPGGSPVLAFGDTTLISVDGIEWREASVPDPPPAHASRAVWTSRGVVIAGIAYRNDNAEVWVSGDGGATIYSIESDSFNGREADISDIAEFQGILVAVGGDKADWIGHHWGGNPITEPGADAGVWIGTWTIGAGER